jgi:threonine-phosphate decarboxylase
MAAHSGDIYSVMEERGISQTALINFSASINPLGTPKNVVLEVKKGLRNLINYPDMNATKLREKLGNVHNIDPQSIICGNGCTELIHLVPRTMGFKKVLVVQPTFSDYERACRIARPECIVTYYMLDRSNDFDVRPQELIDTAVRNNVEAVFMCNPNNPTGRLLQYDGLTEIAQAMRKQKIYFIVDESFIDFSSGKSLADTVENNPYMIVLKSLTKFYALAGLRLGYGIFPIHIAKMLKECKEPWTVSTLAQAAGVAALDESDFKSRSMRLIIGQKRVLEKGFKNLGIDYIPSHANYYLLFTPDAPKIMEQLESSGILLKGCSNFKGLDYRYLRVSVKSPVNNKILLKYLKEFLA